MSIPYVVGLSGNIRRPSKTRELVETVGQALVSRRQVRLDVFDLIDAGPGLGAALRREDLSLPAARIIDAIEKADALIIGTPVYKGAYTGLFKHVFDLVDPAALAGKPVLITATGGGPRHALVVEHSLRPLFGFFTALTIPTAIYASDADFRDGSLVDDGRQGACRGCGRSSLRTCLQGHGQRSLRPVAPARASGSCRMSAGADARPTSQSLRTGGARWRVAPVSPAAPDRRSLAGRLDLWPDPGTHPRFARDDRGHVR